MKSLKFLPILAVLLFCFLAPSVNGFFDPQRAETPIIYQGEDHPWGGEVDPGGGGSGVNRSGQDNATIGSGSIYIFNLIQIIWVPEILFNSGTSSDQNNGTLLPDMDIEIRQENGSDGRGAR